MSPPPGLGESLAQIWRVGTGAIVRAGAGTPRVLGTLIAGATWVGRASFDAASALQSGASRALQELGQDAGGGAATMDERPAERRPRRAAGRVRAKRKGPRKKAAASSRPRPRQRPH